MEFIKKRICIIDIIWGTIIFVLGVITPAIIDDIGFSFIFGSYDKISSIGDAFTSANNYYMNVEGRWV